MKLADSGQLSWLLIGRPRRDIENPPVAGSGSSNTTSVDAFGCNPLYALSPIDRE